MEATSISPGDQIVLTDTRTPKPTLSAAIEAAGYIVGPGVSRKTSLLVAGDPDATTSKAKKATDYGIPIIGEDEFIRRFLGGAVGGGADLPRRPAPATAADLAPAGKRDVAAVKAALAALQDGMDVHVVFNQPGAGDFVVRGPVRYSALMDAWLLAALPVGSKTAPDKAVRSIALAEHDGGAAEPAGDDGGAPAAGVHASAAFAHPVYGGFTVHGKVVRGAGGHATLGTWLLDTDHVRAVTALPEA